MGKGVNVFGRLDKFIQLIVILREIVIYPEESL